MYLKNICRMVLTNTILLVGFIIVCIGCFLYFKHYYKARYNLAFYTCFYGDSDNPAYKIPALPSETYDCYYFSNNRDILQKLEGTKWIQVYDNKQLSADVIQSCMQGKHVKAYPEDFEILTKYDYLCFLDSKLDKLSETFIENRIRKYFVEQNYALLLRHHINLKGSVWNEFNESMNQDRYVKQRTRYVSYIQDQIRSGLQETTENHAQCGLLIRNMKHPNMHDLDKTWYSHILACGIQDQISFYFVKQLFAQDIHMFKEIPFA
jgi:hypothetical protein